MGVTLRVLLVEDYEDDALILLRELRRGGYEPLSERVDTAEAMETALDEREWDLVIADHSMPAFSSLAALELLRSKGFADLPFIIVSGHIGEDVAVAAMKAGAQDYIMKDNLARLNTAIERELREAESRRNAEERRKSGGWPRRSTGTSSRTPSRGSSRPPSRGASSRRTPRWRACSATTRPRICSRTSPTSRSSST